MKTAVIYYSKHHSNTKKLLDAIKENSSDDITLFDITNMQNINLDDYDLIGFASGIYYSKFQKKLLQFACNNIPKNKNVFLVYTFGSHKEGYTKAIREELKKSNARILGEYGCLGFNTFGPFKLIGGMAKNHPNAGEIEGAVSFYNNIRNSL